MDICRKTNQLLSKVQNIDLTHELQTTIAPGLNFRRNTVNLLIGKKGSGKTFNVFREIIKLRFVPNHHYTKLLFVSNKISDPLYERYKNLFPMAHEYVSYKEAPTKIKQIAAAKAAVDELLETRTDLSALCPESREFILRTLGITQLPPLTEPWIHSIVILDDCLMLFDKKTKKNEELFGLLVENRQPKITYFLTLQDVKRIDSSIKQNIDTTWLFGGFTQRELFLLLHYVPVDEDHTVILDAYRRLSKYQAVIFGVGEDAHDVKLMIDVKDMKE